MSYVFDTYASEVNVMNLDCRGKPTPKVGDHFAIPALVFDPGATYAITVVQSYFPFHRLPGGALVTHRIEFQRAFL